LCPYDGVAYQEVLPSYGAINRNVAIKTTVQVTFLRGHVLNQSACLFTEV
jgi:hypothetical protein